MDHREARGELRKPLPKDLEVGVLGGLLELGPDLAQTRGDALGRPRALDEHGRVSGDDHPPRAPERRRLDVLQRDARLVRDDLAARERGQVLEVRDAAVAEAGRPDGHRSQGPVLVVLDHQPERGPVDLLAVDDERPRLLHDRIQRGHQVLDVRDRARSTRRRS
jgi:hypothetical protein